MSLLHGSVMGDSMLSVTSETNLPADTVVGPVPVAYGSLDPLVLIGLRCVDSKLRGQTLRVDPAKSDISDVGVYSEWTLHVQSARDDQEQNMEVVAHEGRLYFRTTRQVKAEDELLVWYGEQVARALAIPSPNTFLFKGDGKFTCPFCSSTFLFPNPCSAHVAYRCEQRRHLSVGQNSLRPPIETPKIKEKTSLASSGFTIDFLSCSSHADSTKSQAKITAGNREPPKRKYDPADCEVIPMKRKEPFGCRDSPSDENTPCGSSDLRMSMISDPNIQGSGPVSKGLTLRQDQWGSAFKKVHKSQPRPLTDTMCGLKPLYSMPFPVPLTVGQPTIPASAFLPTTKMLTDMQTMDQDLAPRVNRSSLYIETPFKMGQYGATKMAQSNAIPPVASLMPPSLTALSFPAQNWCAKCNASFRMTSDLVYHMRSHHKREVDPAKKRRDEKLKCSICHESFRERHHLTRHMTSHQ